MLLLDAINDSGKISSRCGKMKISWPGSSPLSIQLNGRKWCINVRVLNCIWFEFRCWREFFIIMKIIERHETVILSSQVVSVSSPCTLTAFSFDSLFYWFINGIKYYFCITTAFISSGDSPAKQSLTISRRQLHFAATGKLSLPTDVTLCDIIEVRILTMYADSHEASDLLEGVISSPRKNNLDYVK